MLGYVTLGTNKYDEAAQSYHQLFATIGAGSGSPAVVEGDS
jgi:hypothetical protein